jgi:two-component system response regulator MprA
MTPDKRQDGSGKDRRRIPRGGRRAGDRPGRFPRVLVADSYDGARVPCARYLAHFGFHVEQASDGHQALAAIAAAQPAAILIEYRLPVVNAHTLGERLAADKGARAIPLIVMVSDFEVGESPIIPDGAALLVKPFPLATMIEEVRRALREHPPVAAEDPRPRGAENA